jgi:antitoxin (DNA-binding transcriptional repressor) of toxin-antitoxin stability system
MTTVTLEEARERLPELIQMMAAGEKVVIADGDTWLASLNAPPPKPPTPAEMAASQAKREQAVEEMLRWRVEQGMALPNGMTFQDLLNQALGRS